MNVTLTVEEILKIYEMLLRSQSDEILTAKFRDPIQEALTSEQDRSNKEKFEAWSKNELQKIEDLNKKNTSIRNDVATGRLARAVIAKRRDRK